MPLLPWPPPKPHTKTIPPSYAPDIIPRESPSPLLSISTVRVFFLRLVRRRRPAYAAKLFRQYYRTAINDKCWSNEATKSRICSRNDTPRVSIWSLYNIWLFFCLSCGWFSIGGHHALNVGVPSWIRELCMMRVELGRVEYICDNKWWVHGDLIPLIWVTSTNIEGCIGFQFGSEGREPHCVTQSTINTIQGQQSTIFIGGGVLESIFGFVEIRDEYYASGKLLYCFNLLNCGGRWWLSRWCGRWCVGPVL